MHILQGTPTASGVAVGKLFVYSPRGAQLQSEVAQDTEAQLRSLLDAKEKAAEQLRREELIKQRGADVLDARLLLMEDLISDPGISALIREKSYSARRALWEVGTLYRRQFETMEDDFMSARSEDVIYCLEALLRVLGIEKRPFPHLTEPIILLAEELPSEETLYFERPNILALLISKDTPNSIGSLMATLWNIPAVSDLEADASLDGKTVAVNGYEGQVILDPTAEEIDALQKCNALHRPEFYDE